MGKGLNRAKKTTGKKIAKWHDRTGHLPSSLNGTLTQDERALAYMKNHKPYGDRNDLLERLEDDGK